MDCLICNNKLYIKRDFISLFSNKKYLICNSCYRKYPIKLNSYNLVLDKYECIIISIFDRKYNINHDAFIHEYSRIFNRFYKNNSHVLLFYDSLDIANDYNIEMLDIISKLWQKNLFIITFFLKK